MIIPRPHKAFVMRASSTDVSRFEQSAIKPLNKMDTRIAFDLRLVLKPSVYLGYLFFWELSLQKAYCMSPILVILKGLLK